ncbi:peptidase inhibitor family I36 protein [Kitasatospora sp. NPDC048545]|uniref:peptidase inhibitor family I36 protein n=1 Tax=Kitasatospora sp. NPDC048545 TaxID=3157208 RepID=UPI0033EB6771
MRGPRAMSDDDFGYSQQYHYNSYPSHGDDPTPKPAGQPAIYADRNFSGASMTLQAGTYDLTKPGAVGNDSISSVKVPSGWTVTLYADTGLQGASKAFTSDTAYVGDDFNDVASSIKVDNS